MKRYMQAAQSTVGLKLIVAVTGSVLGLFVIGHMLGNMNMLLGRDHMNDYAEKLHFIPELLYVARAGLLAAVFAHVAAVIRLSLVNRSARPVAYEIKTPVASTPASRTMLVSGGFLLVFVIFHLLHFTWGVIQPATSAKTLTDAAGRHDVYGMVAAGFGNAGIALIYVASMVFLGFHLYHGYQSLVQTLGLNTPERAPLTRRAGQALAVLIALGFIAIPLLGLAGFFAGLEATIAQ